jgi:hypothetical protein
LARLNGLLQVRYSLIPSGLSLPHPYRLPRPYRALQRSARQPTARVIQWVEHWAPWVENFYNGNYFADNPLVISFQSVAFYLYSRIINCRRSNARTTPRYACVFLLAFPLLRQFGRASQATEAVTQQITRLFLLHFNESRLPPALRLIRFRGVPPLALGSLPRRTQKAVRVGQNTQRFYVYKNTSRLFLYGICTLH